MQNIGDTIAAIVAGVQALPELPKGVIDARYRPEWHNAPRVPQTAPREFSGRFVSMRYARIRLRYGRPRQTHTRRTPPGAA